MYTLLDACLDRLDIFEFLNHVENGLKDHYDIKVGFHTFFMTEGKFLFPIFWYSQGNFTLSSSWLSIFIFAIIYSELWTK